MTTPSCQNVGFRSYCQHHFSSSDPQKHGNMRPWATHWKRTKTCSATFEHRRTSCRPTSSQKHRLIIACARKIGTDKCAINDVLEVACWFALRQFLHIGIMFTDASRLASEEIASQWLCSLTFLHGNKDANQRNWWT